MSNDVDLLSAVDLAALPDDGQRRELVRGEVRMMSPAGGRHGEVALQLGGALMVHVNQHRLGRTYAAETGFLIERDPDTVRAPDVAFIAAARLGNYERFGSYIPLVPDLVAEVVSPSDRFSDVEGKVQQWLDAGARLVLVITPENRTVREYHAGGEIRMQREGTLDLSEVVPGFAIGWDALFY